ncbi:universal stress protein [Pedobacter hartonius]|uniref:Nucleotide-binding universal stress protein, UspA family n=1 Tax=Pedobacter hartonius TaxID=425514 RepID=A0A1H4G4M9_9SPHI|nr:universal stress protein [Pedobacter hartonius]SEB04514.1 Nucleotide-binding universal stress protein, UspA family [Pedobacter hartonius]
MKKILVPTDFSKPAFNAAKYALHIAENIKANLEFCHAMFVPAETPLTAQVSWPMEDSTVIKKEAAMEFRLLVDRLKKERSRPEVPGDPHPVISWSTETGGVVSVVSKLADRQNVNLVVMGVSGASHLSRFFLGSNSFDMINKAEFPVLLIPQEAEFRGIRKIAFATDLSVKDIDIIHLLAGLAAQFDAEILITHVTTERIEQKHQQKIDAFLSEITGKVNYHKIYYRDVRYKNVNSGLNWLIENIDLDMLVMVHRQHGFFAGLIKSSHTQQLARYSSIPLLVFPEAKGAIACF